MKNKDLENLIKMEKEKEFWSSFEYEPRVNSLTIVPEQKKIITLDTKNDTFYFDNNPYGEKLNKVIRSIIHEEFSDKIKLELDSKVINIKPQNRVSETLINQIIFLKDNKIKINDQDKKSCHTALKSIQNSCNGTKWFIEGDIKGFFDNINHEILINILKERIADDRFIRLIRKFLNAGYVEDWVFHKSYSGTPQGGIISPILANIYLDKFDKYMNEYILRFDKGKRRKQNPIAKRLGQKKAKLKKKLENVKDEVERKRLNEQIREIIK